MEALTTLNTTIQVSVVPYTKNAQITAGYQKMTNGRTAIFQNGARECVPVKIRSERIHDIRFTLIGSGDCGRSLSVVITPNSLCSYVSSSFLRSLSGMS